MDSAIQILNALGMIVPIILGVGIGQKYLPWIRNLTNETIPLVNSVLAFLMAFGVPTAHAGLLGDIGKILSVPGQIAASVLVSYLSSAIHDKFLKGWLPASPYRVNGVK